MRMNTRRGNPSATFLRWVLGVVLLFGVMPNATAGDLTHPMGSVWATSAVLSLTLLTAMKGSQR